MLVLPGNGNGTFGPRAEALRRRRCRWMSSRPTSTGTGGWTWRCRRTPTSCERGPGRINVLLGVNPAPTSVLLAAIPASSTLSDPVTMTATVSPSVATGWVTFNDGATPLGSVPVSGGQATFQTRLLGSGVHLLAAVFSGDGSLYGASASSPVTVRVAAADGCRTRAVRGALAFRGDAGGTGRLQRGRNRRPRRMRHGGRDRPPGPRQRASSRRRRPFNGCQRAVDLLAADFNRDGKTDLAAGTTLSFGNGDGTFENTAGASPTRA